MTDSRLPGPWLTDPVMDGLSDRAWRTFTGALMWSNQAGTDGALPKRAMRFLHPEGIDPAAVKELMTAGLLEADGDGYRVPNWIENGQELASVINWRKDQARKRQQDWRNKKKPKPSDGDGDSDATRDATRDGDRDVGQKTEDSDSDSDRRQKTAIYDGGAEDAFDARTDEPVSAWPTALPGQPNKLVHELPRVG